MLALKEKNGALTLSPVLFFFLLSAILFFAPGVSAIEPIKIGLLGPPPNEGGEGFKSYLWGAEIAAAEVNAREGKQGLQFLLAIRAGNFKRERDLKDLREFLVEERIHFLLGQVRQEFILPIARIVQEQKMPFLVFSIDFLGAGSSGKEPPTSFGSVRLPRPSSGPPCGLPLSFQEIDFFFLPGTLLPAGTGQNISGRRSAD